MMFTEQDVKKICQFGLKLKKISAKLPNGIDGFEDTTSHQTFFADTDERGQYAPAKTKQEFFYAMFSNLFVEAITKMIEENEMHIKSLDFLEGKFVGKYDEINNQMIEQFSVTALESLNEIEKQLLKSLESEELKQIKLSRKNFEFGGKQILETFSKTNVNLDALCNTVLDKNIKKIKVKTTKLESGGRKIEKLFPLVNEQSL